VLRCAVLSAADLGAWLHSTPRQVGAAARSLAALRNSVFGGGHFSGRIQVMSAGVRTANGTGRQMSCYAQAHSPAAGTSLTAAAVAGFCSSGPWLCLCYWCVYGLCLLQCVKHVHILFAYAWLEILNANHSLRMPLAGQGQRAGATHTAGATSVGGRQQSAAAHAEYSLPKTAAHVVHSEAGGR
jgi:hypothetical protein